MRLLHAVVVAVLLFSVACHKKSGSVGDLVELWDSIGQPESPTSNEHRTNSPNERTQLEQAHTNLAEGSDAQHLQATKGRFSDIRAKFMEQRRVVAEKEKQERERKEALRRQRELLEKLRKEQKEQKEREEREREENKAVSPVIAEIIDSENLYIQNQQKLLQWVVGLKLSADNKLTPLIGILRAIIAFHSEFYQKTQNVNVGLNACEKIKSLATKYEHYIRAWSPFHGAVVQKHEDFADVIRHLPSNVFTKELPKKDLMSYLIQTVQTACRLQLLVEALLKPCPAQCKSELHRILELTKEAATKINGNKRIYTELQLLRTLTNLHVFKHSDTRSLLMQLDSTITVEKKTPFFRKMHEVKAELNVFNDGIVIKDYSSGEYTFLPSAKDTCTIAGYKMHYRSGQMTYTIPINKKNKGVLEKVCTEQQEI